jgi:hypothetical protein
MNKPLAAFCIVTLVFGGGYWYYTAFAGCNVPIGYRIDTVDERFDISNDEVRNAISAAESLWEDGTDRNLFTYDPEGDLSINFVYDDRQRTAEEEEELREVLDQKEGMSESVKEEYDSLVGQYQTLRTTYREAMNTYESKLAAYNAEVAEWNERGGAPKDVFERLNETKISLAKEEKRLREFTPELNTLARKINSLGSEGNSIISDYNSLVSEYNDRFSEGGEFTQGDYGGDAINIYEFGSKEELTLVLAHELGHALGLDHVEGETSVMYHHMDAQSLETGLTENDRAAFLLLCGAQNSTRDTLHMIGDNLMALWKYR